MNRVMPKKQISCCSRRSYLPIAHLLLERGQQFTYLRVVGKSLSQASVDALPHPGKGLGLPSYRQTAIGRLQLPEFADFAPESIHALAQQSTDLDNLRVPEGFVVVCGLGSAMLAQQAQR